MMQAHRLILWRGRFFSDIGLRPNSEIPEGLYPGEYLKKWKKIAEKDGDNGLIKESER